MSFELWDTESGTVIESFACEAEALVAVRQLIAVNEPDYTDALALAEENSQGETRLIAEGAALAIRAGAASAERGRRSA
jgi:hypothetical protein